VGNLYLASDERYAQSRFDVGCPNPQRFARELDERTRRGRDR
jgi:hypothetical protein